MPFATTGSIVNIVLNSTASFMHVCGEKIWQLFLHDHLPGPMGCKEYTSKW